MMTIGLDLNTVKLNHDAKYLEDLMLKFPQQSSKAKSRLLAFPRWRHFVFQSSLMYTERCVQNKTAFKFAENHANCFKPFEAVGSQT